MAILGASWAVVGASGAVSAHFWEPLRLSWGDLWGLLGRLGASGSRTGENPPNLEKQWQSMIFDSWGPRGRPLGGLLGRLGGLLGRLGAILGVFGRSFGVSGLSWTVFRGLLGRLGGLLGCLEDILGVFGRSFGDSGPSWTVLGASWDLLGPSWRPLGPGKVTRQRYARPRGTARSPERFEKLGLRAPKRLLRTED